MDRENFVDKAVRIYLKDIKENRFVIDTNIRRKFNYHKYDTDRFSIIRMNSNFNADAFDGILPYQDINTKYLLIDKISIDGVTFVNEDAIEFRYILNKDMVSDHIDILVKSHMSTKSYYPENYIVFVANDKLSVLAMSQIMTNF